MLAVRTLPNTTFSNVEGNYKVTIGYRKSLFAGSIVDIITLEASNVETGL
jgi:hypothetical protein